MNELLGENLAARMEEKGLSNRQLGALAGIAPNTIANYKRAAAVDPGDRTFTDTGKERSAKLTEVEMLASALGVPPLALLADRSAIEALAQHMAAAMLGLPAPSSAEAAEAAPKAVPRKRAAAGGG